MKFVPLSLDGAWKIVADVHSDIRGEYQRTFLMSEFRAHGLSGEFVESGLARNYAAGTLRGLHYQLPPREQAKLIRCLRGSIVDIIVDLRPDSPTFKQHQLIWLMNAPPVMVYVPAGFAHGYQTLTEQAEVEYHMTNVHVPELAAGVRYNDPSFGIELPIPVKVILERDQTYPDFR